MLASGCFATGANAQSARTLKNFAKFEKVTGSFHPVLLKTKKTADFRELHAVGSRGWFPAGTWFPAGSWSAAPVVQENAPAPMGKLAPDYIFSQWGIICVGEYRLQQKTGLPLRFRLGSLEYVNALEGK
jgi:hypothetical protein